MPDMPRGRRPGQAATSPDDHAGGGHVTAIVARPSVTWCPCGCLTKLPWYDDPDCIRHKPLPAAVDWPSYDKQALGMCCGHTGPECPAWRRRHGGGR